MIVEPLEDRRLMAVVDLADPGSFGAVVRGQLADFPNPSSVHVVGDINGDGFEDFVMGAPRFLDLSHSNLAGRSYVVFGGSTFPANIDLNNLGSNGITISGTVAQQQIGSSVSGAGDVNADGFDDLLIGAPKATVNGSEGAGKTYLIYGGAALPSSISLSDDLGALGLVLVGSTTHGNVGSSVSGAGDVNGDGFDDLLIGSSFASANRQTAAGAAYLVYGRSSFPPMITLSSELDTLGVVFTGGALGDQTGFAVSGGGDINGDGFDDVIIGAPSGFRNFNGDNAGRTYVVFGALSLQSAIDLGTIGQLGTPAGFTIKGAAPGDISGISVSHVGDFNRDGFDDLIVGASGAKTDSASLIGFHGKSFLIFGGVAVPSSIDLAVIEQASPPLGVVFKGAIDRDYSGGSVSGAGDVNGDGFDDLLIGASGADPNGRDKAGRSYLFFGSDSYPAAITLSDSLGLTGVTFLGQAAGDAAGSQVAGSGDFNGDGFDDIILHSPLADYTSPANDGRSYVIYGSNRFTNTIAAGNLGGAGPDTLTGTNGDEVLSGADGNDTLNSMGGADVLLGGRGDDVFAVRDLQFQKIVGGRGRDTLRFEGSGHAVDVTNIPSGRLLDIEEIDITGNGNNNLVVSTADVLQLSSSTNTLRVRYNLGDNVRYDGDWRFRGLRFGAGAYVHLYADGPAELELANHLPFQNPVNRFDAGFDGNLSPVDVLVVINTLARTGSRELSPTTPGISFYVDVDGDGFIAPIDVLQIINALNRRAQGEGELAVDSAFTDMSWIESMPTGEKKRRLAAQR